MRGVLSMSKGEKLFFPLHLLDIEYWKLDIRLLLSVFGWVSGNLGDPTVNRLHSTK
jgi:hypothetical protein